ncbi:MAG TPA: glycoside hydrolase family 3 N-terminal domain-containing protein, partial [Bauldia sp.]|nr:glycoside hydrolase family 3 N-terminal domain-containing protein [Bauldia sp.]
RGMWRNGVFHRLPALIRFLVVVLPIAMAHTAIAGAPSVRPSVAYRPEPVMAAGLHPDRAMETLGRKVGQMLIIGFPGTRPDDPWPSRVAALMEAGRIGGVILFAENVRNPTQLRTLTRALAEAGGRFPPFIAVDQEGGSIQRLTRRKGFQALPSARRMAQKPLCEAHALYLQTARELASNDINVNFGPVVDLDVNPGNPAIGRKARSYDRDPRTVVAYAETFIDAHAAVGVLTAAKHFPGHGSATGDPHLAIVDIGSTWVSEELTPFAELISDHQVPMVMVGHLIHPRFSDGDRPTSLSRRTITGELRGALGFDGLVVTDDLGMDAIARRFSPEEAAIMAIRAGADILIFANQPTKDPTVLDRIVTAVTGAIAAGRLPQHLVETSYRRIRAAREQLGRRPAPPTAVTAVTPACPEPRAGMSEKAATGG